MVGSVVLRPGRMGRGHTHTCTRTCVRGPARPSAELVACAAGGGPGSAHRRLSQGLGRFPNPSPAFSDGEPHVFTRQKDNPRFRKTRGVGALVLGLQNIRGLGGGGGSAEGASSWRGWGVTRSPETGDSQRLFLGPASTSPR